LARHAKLTISSGSSSDFEACKVCLGLCGGDAANLGGRLEIFAADRIRGSPFNLEHLDADELQDLI
jgi:hypothetical protein